ncbi:uncharacterized protein K452DRAFT_310458 [Aplosporella prunicola CBS 121167]|uniref:Uncharacterized protein n=1 Tax=Aplosporella prunicola CBS 121167 TaxID=1176127 RepID=A0A6A6B6J7_9PEZI|nr:uncharacterized protein K452DRAFT_310458 [Aplosporella prunicola CBS 121167]KAF2139496.1 hypothetical protein K452DRAFT_310458 [Aplosporella prunicola CBS 121167]
MVSKPSNIDQQAALCNILAGFGGQGGGESTIQDIGDKHTAKFILPSQQRKAARRAAQQAQQSESESLASYDSSVCGSYGSECSEYPEMPSIESLDLSHGLTQQMAQVDSPQQSNGISIPRKQVPRTGTGLSTTPEGHTSRGMAERPRRIEQLRRFLIWRLCCDYNHDPTVEHLGFKKFWDIRRFDRLASIQSKALNGRTYERTLAEAYVRRHITIPAAELGVPEATVRAMLLRHRSTHHRFEAAALSLDNFDMTDFPALAEKLWTDRTILFSALDVPEPLRQELESANAHLAWQYFKKLRGPTDFELSEKALALQQHIVVLDQGSFVYSNRRPWTATSEPSDASSRPHSLHSDVSTVDEVPEEDPSDDLPAMDGLHESAYTMKRDHRVDSGLAPAA